MKAIFRAFSGMSALLFLALAGTALAQQPTLAEQAELMKESDPVLAPAPVPVQAPAPAPAPAGAPLAGKATIGVMAWSDFVPDRAEPMKGQRIGLPAELADRIIEGLSASGRFTVVERAALRRVVVEQRFGSRLQESYLDRTLDKAIGVMEQVQDGGGVLVSPSASEGESRVLAGEGAIGTTGALADFNDLIKDYKDLGMATGAQFLVLGELEKVEDSSHSSALPYSRKGYAVQDNSTDARLRLRVIDAWAGTVVGATNIRTTLSERVFSGANGAMSNSDSDAFSIYDTLGQQAATAVLDLTFPAKIVNLNPLVMSRGSNDGVSVGAVYRVEREGQEIREPGGLVIGRLKSAIGELRVVTVQDTIAVLMPVSGSGFQNGDLLIGDAAAQAAALPAAAAPVATTSGKQAGKATLAVGLVTANKLIGRKVSSWTEGNLRRLRDGITVGLQNSGRFVLLERSEMDQVLGEKEFDTLTHGGDISARLSQLGNADYLVHAQVDDIEVTISRSKVPYLDEIQINGKGVAEGTIRVVKVADGSMLAAESIRIQQDMQRIDNARTVLNAMMDQFVDEAVALVMTRIYPHKVVGVGGDGVVYINAGRSAGIEVGDHFDVMREGRELIDPDTGQSFGRTSNRIGGLEITRVEDGRALARVVDGQVPASGDLLRAAVVVVQQPQVRQPNW